MPETKKHKRGDVREDGMVFWQREKSCDNREYWVTSKKFSQLNQNALASKRHYRSKLKEDYHKHPRLLSRGDTREDGKIFWVYNLGSVGFEDWLTPDAFQARKDKMLKYKRSKRKSDPLFRFRENTRCLIRNSLINKNYTKKSKTFNILGCTYKCFINHIVDQFTEGMTLDNYGEWHLDHILPVAAATTKEEVIALNHYTNFQPMWASDNISKHTKHCPKELKAYLNKMIEVV